MAYARLDDNAVTHPKLLALSDTAWRLWASGLIYCNAKLTDGYIPSYALSTLGVRGNTAKAAQELCKPWRAGAAPLWSLNEDGFQVHDYLDWNMSRTDVLAERDRKRTNKESWKNRARTARVSGSAPAENQPGTMDPLPLPIRTTTAPSEPAPPAPKLTRAEKAPESPIRRLQLRYAEMLALNLGVENPELNWEKVGSIFKMALEKFDEPTVRNVLEKFMLDRDPFLVRQAWPIGLFRPRFNQYLPKPQVVTEAPSTAEDEHAALEAAAARPGVGLMHRKQPA